MKRLSISGSLFFSLLLIASIAAVSWSVHPQKTLAVTGTLSGWAWSDTIGWISLSCTTGGPSNSNICVTNNYGITVNTTNGVITGYAWSDNIGWIKFGGLSTTVGFTAFPSGSGTTASDATKSGDNMRGWARACAGTTNGDCSTMTSRLDGWDGWIALSGGTGSSAYAASFVGANTYAWGSDVVGWINFNPTLLCTVTPANSPKCGNGTNGPVSTILAYTNAQCTYYPAKDCSLEKDNEGHPEICRSGECIPIPIPQPAVQLSASSNPNTPLYTTSARKGNSVWLWWTAINTSQCWLYTNGVDTQLYINGTLSYIGTQASGAGETTPILQKSVYTLSCKGTDSLTYSTSVTINLIPTIKEI